MTHRLLAAGIVFSFALVSTGAGFAQQDDTGDATELTDDDPMKQYRELINHFETKFPVEEGWSRVEEFPFMTDNSASSGSSGSFTFCRESKGVQWLYAPIVDRPYTDADIADIRLAVFGLGKDNEIKRIETIRPVRWASNASPTSLTLLEFKLEQSEWRPVPADQIMPAGSPAPEADGTLVFLEQRKRTEDGGVTESESEEEAESNSNADGESSDSGFATEEQLLEAETNALLQNADQLWLVPPQPANSFDSRFISLTGEFIGHIAMRKTDRGLVCMVFGVADKELQGFPRLILTGPDGREISGAGGGASMSSVDAGDSEKTLFHCRTNFESGNLPEYGTIGLFEEIGN